MLGSVVWPKGRPPSDKPECGFNNELCEWLINGKVTFITEVTCQKELLYFLLKQYKP